MSDLPDRIDEALEALPPACPTCGSKDPRTYYGSCFDNQHSTIFDPRLPLDPWHEYVHSIIRLTKAVDSLELQRDVSSKLLGDRDDRLREAGDRIRQLETAIEAHRARIGQGGAEISADNALWAVLDEEQ